MKNRKPRHDGIRILAFSLFSLWIWCSPEAGLAQDGLLFGTNHLNPSTVSFFDLNNAFNATDIGKALFLTTSAARHPNTGIVYYTEHKLSDGRIAFFIPHFSTILGGSSDCLATPADCNVQIDPGTGNPKINHRLAFSPGASPVLYVSQDNTNNIYTIDLQTGDVIFFGDLDFSTSVNGDIAFNRLDIACTTGPFAGTSIPAGSMFIVSKPSLNQLRVVKATDLAACTPPCTLPTTNLGNVGTITDTMTGLGFSFDDVLYGMTRPTNAGTDLYEIDPCNPATVTLRKSYTASQGTTDLTSNIGTATTPVSLAWFRAKRTRAGTRISWSTATESGNIGFHVYGSTRSGWRRLTTLPIPSRAGDSLDRRDYSFVVRDPRIRRFMIADIDILTQERFHGPFDIGRDYGKRVSSEPIDWEQIGTEHAALEESREAQRRDSIAATLNRMQGAKLPEGGIHVADLLVETSGIYRVRFEDLQGAGFDLGGYPMAWATLENQGKKIPIHTSGEAFFGPGSYIEFYGQALDSLYTHTNVYRLLLDPASGPRIAVDDHFPQKGTPVAESYLENASQERDLGYSFSAPNGDPWYDTKMLAFTSPETFQFEIDIDAYRPGRFEPQLWVSLWGATQWPNRNPDHHIVVQLNGETVAEKYFDGLKDEPLFIPLDAGLLQEGSNRLTLTLPADTGARWDLIYLDAFGVKYPRAFVAKGGMLHFSAEGKAFRVENLPSSEVVVYRRAKDEIVRLESLQLEALDGAFAVRFAGAGTPADYWVVSQDALLTPKFRAPRPPVDLFGDPADYLIISHPDFLEGLAPLIEAREKEGFRVKLVDVEDVYARFGGGIFGPEAIERYIAEAVRELGVEYVLLVGGDSYDYLDHLGQGAISFLPTIYLSAGEIVSFAPSDTAYAFIDGDGKPDVAIGRFPVRTNEELASMIEKTLTYEGKGYARKAVFAADARDSASSFAQASDDFIEMLPGDWDFTRVYLDDLDVESARADLLSAIEGGVALTSYFGHSSMTSWSYKGLFTTEEAEALSNADRPTVVSQWGCWNTYFVSPEFNTLGHKLLLSGNRGAAAVLGSSTLTRSSAEAALGRYLMPRLLTPGTPIGKAILEAKRELAEEAPELFDVLLGWTLLGDPALVIDR